jgi:MATE family multidrug resistance protein
MTPAGAARRRPPRGLRGLLAPAELREMGRLAAPAVVVQVGIMMMGVVDTVMAGRISAGALAAVALGNLYVFNSLVFGMGVLMALDPIVAQAVGARDEAAVGSAVQRAIAISAALSVAVGVALWPGEALLGALRQPADVVPDAAAYARASIPGVFPFYLFIVLRQTLQAFGRMAPIVWVVLAANLLNAALNWVLMLGHLGAPRLGPVGSAWSTTIGRWAMALGLLAVGWAALRPHLRRLAPQALRAAPLARTLGVGVPIGVQYMLEVGAFGVATLLVGLFGTTALAGHEITLNLASLTFMVPLGVASAGSVLVGRAVGAGDAAAARLHAAASLVYGVGFMAVSAVLLLLAPRAIAALYTRDAGVLAVAATLIPIAGVFQVFDGGQVVAGAVLRGSGDTRTPLVANLAGFWVVGLPLGGWLAFSLGGGPAGLWWGLVAGLAAVALLLVWRVRRRLAGAVERLDVERTLTPSSPPGAP